MMQNLKANFQLRIMEEHPMMKIFLFLILAIPAAAQTYVQTAPTTSQSVVQPSGTNMGVNILQHVYYAAQYCSVPGTLDQTCLSNAITAAGNNSKIILSPGTYNFSSKLTVSNLTNVEIVGSGDNTIIKSNGTAFECDSCTGGGISSINFSSSVTPTVISCTLNLSARNMSCPGLPTTPSTEIITLDPWQQGVGHIPTGTDVQLLGSSSLLSATQTSENFDSGVFYYKPTNVKLERLTGTYNHIVLMDSVGSVVTNNKILGGNGAADTNRSTTPGNRCGGICLWFSTNQAPGWFSNIDNTISNNVVTYPASEGIALNNAISTIVSNNQVSYGGESGILTGQGLSSTIATPTGTVTAGSTTVSGLSSTASLVAGQVIVGLFIPQGTTIVSVGSGSIVISNAATTTNTELLSVYSYPGISYFAAQSTIIGNVINNMDFDGIDVSSDYPHSNRVSVYLTLTGNTSCNNFGTGIFGDGQYATVSGNTVCNNESYGIALDNANSTITGNTAVDNNHQKNSANAQIAVGGITTTGLVVTGGNTVVGNHANTSSGSGINGYGTYTTNLSGATNVVDNNYTIGGLADSNSGYITNAIYPGILVSGASTDSRVQTILSQSVGSYTPILQAHDALIFTDINSGLTTGGLVLAAHSSNATGIRIDGANNVLELWGGTIKSNGNPGITHTISLPCGSATYTNGLLTSVTGTC
jgi:hypothetical protein